MGASGLYTSTALRFSGSLRADETRSAVLASLSYAPSRRLTLVGALGATVGGDLDTPAGTYHFSPGIIGAVGSSWRALDRPRSFVVLTSLLSFSNAPTRLAGTSGPSTNYSAFDLRLGAVAGTTFFGHLSPYALGRVFGGPVYWHYQGAAVTGSDTHHFQLGAGMALLVVRHLDVYVEAIPLGERALSTGASVMF